jgi:phosphatidylethanolamine-binding protein (PEBP) family uncharacterized protein
MKLKAAALGLLLAALVNGPALAGEFAVTSPSLSDGATIGNKHVFAGFGCTGDNRSPALSWTGAPVEAKSFAVTVYDPDAPTGSGWWHWVVFNIPAGTSVQSVTDFGQPGFGGPCPPAGDKPHRYIFTVHALKLEKLPLETGASGAMVGFFLGQNTIAKASVTGLYGR